MGQRARRLEQPFQRRDDRGSGSSGVRLDEQRPLGIAQLPGEPGDASPRTAVAGSVDRTRRDDVRGRASHRGRGERRTRRSSSRGGPASRRSRLRRRSCRAHGESRQGCRRRRQTRRRPGCAVVRHTEGPSKGAVVTDRLDEGPVALLSATRRSRVRASSSSRALQKRRPVAFYGRRLIRLLGWQVISDTGSGSLS